RVTDAISDVLLVSDPAGLDHLEREGVASNKITYVGNVMIDTLVAAREIAERSEVVEQMGLSPREYLLVTLHRPSNVDEPETLVALLEAIEQLEPDLKNVFPIHPRTRQRLENAGVELDPERWLLTEPLGYFEFLRLQMAARAVLTDSGGIQEETTVLGVPCVTVRDNTERPVTIVEGTNVLAGTRPEAIDEAYREALDKADRGRVPKYWDGRAAERVVDALDAALGRFA
ncbi:MAG TPA: UDP-N-acetyl glucosamine 2-epimerase, partial [Polyangiaceae bacterium]|nr:UDP-N-acetyl glucosamine 2-epimerase [Polyangiaceae bacterium]